MNNSGLITWWERRRQERAQRALVRQLEYQENKAQYFLDTHNDPTKFMAKRSLYVRSMLDNVQKITAESRVLEVGSGAHGLIFYFDAQHSVGIDPLAHHYVNLFPGWQRRVHTVSAYGESLPFPDQSFDVVLSDNVVDHAQSPTAIIAEIARVLSPSGTFYFSVNISHPIFNMISHSYGLLKAIGIPVEFSDFADHTTHFTLKKAKQLFSNVPLRIVWEADNIRESRLAIRKRPVRRLRALVRSVLYQARYEVIAIRE